MRNEEIIIAEAREKAWKIKEYSVEIDSKAKSLIKQRKTDIHIT
jgi:hypothetical protein